MGSASPSVLRRSTWIRFREHVAVITAALVWIPAVGVGIRALLRYSNTPGRLAAPPLIWPQSATFRAQPGRATLLVFAHPQCPCSRATFSELALVMARYRSQTDAYVLFYARRAEGGWGRTELWKTAAAIPGVQPIEDQDGDEARRFGVSTSGQTLLYDPNGRLLFNGGLTVARGHAGANDGRDAIVSLLSGGASPRNTTPVFGCSLLGGA